jgi:hypothetical protein
MAKNKPKDKAENKAKNRKADPSFQMTIRDVFSIEGRDTIATGRVERGTVSLGDEIFIRGQNGLRKTVVTGFQTVSTSSLTCAKIGDIVGVCLKDIAESDVTGGDLLLGSDTDIKPLEGLPYDEVVRFLSELPGPSPWYLEGKSESATWHDRILHWESIQPWAVGKSKTCLCSDSPLLIVDIYSVVHSLSENRFLIVNELPSSMLRMSLVQIDSLTPIGSLERACSSMEESHEPVYAEGGLIASQSIPLTLKLGTNPVQFDASFSAVPAYLALANNTNICAGHKKGPFRAIYDIRPASRTVSVYPQDWYNQGDFDTSYQWPSRVARHPSDERIYGDGVRMGVFLLSEDGTQIARWLK